MDLKQVSFKITPVAKTATNSITRALDVIAPSCAPLAARWDAEATRRKSLRTPENLKALMQAQAAHTSARSTAAQARTQLRAANKVGVNPLSGPRRAARTANRAARRQQRQARVALKTARQNYPSTLRRVAVQAHAVHAVPAAVASYVLSSPVDWAVWPAGSSLALIASHVAALALGRRAVSVAPVDGDLSAEEKRLAERLDPSYWVQHVGEWNLTGTLTTPAEVTPLGLVSHVRLDPPMTLKTFRAKLDEIGGLLGARQDLKIEVRPGTHKDRAMLVLRTRSAVDADALIWTPDSVGVGIDLETGEPVVIPIEGTHKGVAAATNMGKSTFWRPWMMEAVANPLMAGVLLDPKRQEARMWHGKIRTEGHQRDGDIRQYIYDGVCELEREMRHRQSIAEVSQWVPTPEYPILLVVIEEMANIVRMAKEKQWKDVLDKLDGLFSEARAAGIWFVWATQFPSRSGGGITPQIAENTLTMVALTTEGPTADQVIFGNDGPAKGWKPSELGGVPGRALVKHKKSKPHAIQGWFVTDDTIKALPDAVPWRHRGAAEEAPAFPTQATLRLVKDPAPAPVAPAAAPTNRDKVKAAIEAGAKTGADVALITGINKGSVSKAIKALVDAGEIVRAEDGTLSAATQAGEVSA